MITPPTSSRKTGFTLVELLTVIAIIAILMGILFPTIGSAIESAKKAQAKNDTIQIVTAVKGYFTEYGKYPSVTGASYATASSGSNATDWFAGEDDNNNRLFDVLRATAQNPVGNPRKIVFLEIPSVKKDTVGKRQKGIAGDGRWYDPWGNVYRIRIDNSYTNQVENPYGSGAGFNPIDTGVIAWSIGKDGEGAKNAAGGGNKNNAPAKDDVISWQ